jgi:hypothetical protein
VKGWLWNLYRGPVTKLADVPHPRLPLRAPAAADGPSVAELWTQTA